MKVRGLTLWRPWPWAILSGLKRCENRPRRWNIEGYILAIHAGQRFDADAARVIATAHPSMPMRKYAHASGVIEGAARVWAVLTSAEAQERGVAWAADTGFVYMLDRVVRFPTPITGIMGRQGLFKLDAGTEGLVRTLWERGV